MPVAKDINLLPYEERAQERFETLQKRLSMASVGFLALATIFTMVTLVFYTALASARSKLVNRISESSNTINTYKSTEELLVVVKSKVSAADKTLGTRTDFPKVFESFSRQVPQDVYFTAIKIAASKITTSGKAKTSADVAGLVSALLSPEGSKIISSINVEALNRDDNAAYNFSISGELK